MVSTSQFGDSLLCRMPSAQQALKPAISFSTGSMNLTKAMSLCALEDAIESGGLAMSQDQPQGPSQGLTKTKGIRIPKRLALELQSQPSQELLCTQDFATPVEQQFHIEYDPSAISLLEDEASRSPAPSPIRYPKRPRPVNQDNDSDCTSQASLSQSRSQGEPSSCSKATTAAPSLRPPIPKAKKRYEPPVIRNPYTHPGTDDNHIYHPSHHKLDMPPRHSRLSWDYKVESTIGHGNFSTVYRAVHRQSGKSYAIKRSKKPLLTVADKNAWLAEIQALAAVEGHPNIITFYDSWTESTHDVNPGDIMFIKLELCSESLGTKLLRKEKFREQQLWEIMRQIASALKHIHDLGLVHLDVKPDNIYTSASGLYKLGDFGLATQKDGSGRVIEGDARYLSPELLNNHYGSLDKADMFALGATLYELATGGPLPTGGERYHAIRSGTLTMLPHISMKMQNIIKKLMSADAKQRPDAASILASCSRQMGTLQLQASSPSPRAMTE